MFSEVNISNYEDLISALVLIIPGFVALYVKSILLTGRRAKFNESLFSYIFVSVLYFFATYWIFNEIIICIKLHIYFYLFVYMLLVPSLLGLFLGIIARENYIVKILKKFNINTVHEIPTSWDWKFFNCKSCFVVVRMKSGFIYRGYFGENSFASSDGEKDLYIEKLYSSKSAKGKWIPENRSLWIKISEVESIEFLEEG